MPSFLVLVLSIATVIGVVIVAIRLLLKKKSNELSERIATITPYRNIQESREKELSQSNKSFFINYVLYDKRFPSVFVDEFLHPEKVTEESYAKHPNANKKWTRSADKFLLTLYHEGKSIKYIAEKMGRSQTSIVMRIGKLEDKQK